MYRDGAGPGGNDDGARGSYYPQPRPFTLNELRQGWGDEITDRVMSFGRHYTTGTGQPYWLPEDSDDLLGLADMELRQEREEDLR
jgi:hypothetical protein